ncbi:MAG: hypothetical protein H7070_06335 [Saprospiraceae bacterium]|nr:hypothetical protein [Pyrinomonadaceae bacterium]
MDNDREKNQDNEAWLKDIPVRSEDIGFKAEEMSQCPKCGKNNPPTRPNCFYCTADLEVHATEIRSAKLNLRRLEPWEKGFNIINLPGSLKTLDTVSITRLLSMDADHLKQVTEAEGSIPIARLESRKEAEAAVEILSQYGLESKVIGDDELLTDKLPVRLRGLEFCEEILVLTLFNTNEKRDIRYSEISLIITGAIFESRTETVEKRKKKDREILLETQTSSDGDLIDIYTFDDPAGYRVPVKGFDFSCLGADKGLLAAENIRRLIVDLRSFAPGAKFVSDYVANRALLGIVWEVERRKDSSGLQRTGFGRKDFTNVESSNNLQQFTKYSRLQRHLL